MDDVPVISRSDAGRLVTTGKLNGSKYLGALGLFRDAKQWNDWIIKALFALGVGHILAGIICFFAFNWADLSPEMKFGVVQGGLIVSVLLWLLLRLNSSAAQAFGIVATIFTGVLLAVFGQVYQTPAAIYTPFVLWALLTLPFALASKSVAHWAVWLAIAVTAALTFIEDGIALSLGRNTAYWAYLALAALLMGVSALYHIVSRVKMSWARTSWFRLSILLVALFIAVTLFFNLFWAFKNHFVWGGSYALVGGALYVIYRFWPTLPALSLTAFVFISMSAQFGLKIIVDAVPGGADEIGQIFLIFLWLAFITYVLARTFRFFQNKFDVSRQDTVDQEIFAARELSVTHDDVASETGLGLPEIEAALTVSEETDQPWYMDVLIGMSGVITAIFAVLFLAVLLGLIISGADMMLFIALGFVTWCASLYARMRSRSQFTRHFFNTLILAGGGLCLGATGVEFDGNIIFIIVSISALVFTLWRINDRIIGFLMGAGFSCILVYAVAYYDVPLPYVWLCPVLMIFALIGLAKPIGKRLYNAAGSACLIGLPFWGAVLDNPDILGNSALPATWFGVAVSVICTGAAVYMLNRMGPKGDTFKPPIVIFVPLLLATAIMPVGAAAALLVVLIGYILGSRALAIIGVASQIYFLHMFYYDLQITLLNKSIMLVVSGVILVMIWAYIRKPEAQHA